MGRRLTLIILVGAAAIAAALYAPSWVDHRQSPQVVLSARVVNFDSVRINVPTEQLLTIRNDGHTSITDRGGSGSLRDFSSVCPRRLGRHQRVSNCGFSVSTANDCETLQPRASCALAIHFTPRVARPYHARYCFDYAATDQDWRRTVTCVTVTGKGVRGGKRRPAR